MQFTQKVDVQSINMEAMRSAADHAEQYLLRPLEAWHEHQEVVSIELGELALGHAERSDGLLTVLPIDPETYPAQKITKPYVDSQPAKLKEIIDTASLAEAHYPAMLNALMASEKESMTISQLGEDLAAGQNIIIVTNHGEIKDIAIVLAAYDAAIKLVGAENGREYEFTNNIVLSKMIAHLGAIGEPAVDILGKMCDRQYFSFPRTKSIKNSKISSALVDVYNPAMRALVKHRLGAGGNLFAMAPSGTVDKPLDPENPGQLSLAPIGSGTAKILTADNTKVLPVATWLKDDHLVFEPLGIARSIQGESEERNRQNVDSMMHDMAEVLTSEVPDKQFVYTAKAN